VYIDVGLHQHCMDFGLSHGLIICYVINDMFLFVIMEQFDAFILVCVDTRNMCFN
jgi:hypothetical protein